MKFLANSSQGSFYTVLGTGNELKSIMEDRKYFFEFDKNIGKIDFIKNPTWKLSKKNLKDKSTKDEWFFIDYSTNKNIQTIINRYTDNLESSGQLSNLTTDIINKINFLLNAKKVEEKYSINLQVVKNTSYIRSRQFLKIGSGIVKYKTEENILNLTDNIDVHISEKDNKIYFKHFSNIKKIDEVFMELYRESTTKELLSFKEQVNECSIFSMKQFSILESNSKSIRYILDKSKVDFSKDKDKIKTYINKYPTNLNKDDKGLYSIHSNKDLTNFLKVINEHYYEGEITGNHRESNSSREC